MVDDGSSALSSLVHPLETQEQGPGLEWPPWAQAPREDFSIEPVTRIESNFRHSGWQPNRKRVWDAFCCIRVASSRLWAFAHCGSGCWVEKSKDEIRIRANSCHDRWCMSCQRGNAFRLKQQIEPLINPADTRFLTLTLRHSNTELKDQIDRLFRSLKELRRRPIWKQNVVGAIIVLELKIGRDDRWHPHLHCIIKGRWMDQKEISREWQRVTGDSSIVDIRPVKDQPEVAAYVTKYLTKPVSQDVITNPSRLKEAIEALKGRRLINASGCWKNVKLREKPEKVQPADGFEKIGRLEHVLFSREPEMIRWREALVRRYPCFSRFLKENTS